MDTTDELYRLLLSLLDSIGTYSVEHKNNSIHIVRERAFVGVHPKKSYLGINIVLDRSKASPPASKVEKVSANRFHHYYKITDRKKLNRSFVRLLQEAYHLAGPEK
jgi:hypothetical protein